MEVYVEFDIIQGNVQTELKGKSGTNIKELDIPSFSSSSNDSSDMIDTNDRDFVCL